MTGTLQPGGALTNRRVRRRSRLPMSEINVTPMVDVMLVLLVIFMVTAPLLTMGVGVGAGAGEAATGEVPLNISVAADGKIFVDDKEIGFDELMPRLAVFRDASGGTQVWVRGDESTPFGDVARVLVEVREAGLSVTVVAGGS